jgi:hypothetical protein
MNQFDHLPIVDLSEFATFTAAEAPHMWIDPESQKSEELTDRLAALLGVGKFIWYYSLALEKLEPGTRVAFRQLIPVAQKRVKQGRCGGPPHKCFY